MSKPTEPDAVERAKAFMTAQGMPPEVPETKGMLMARVDAMNMMADHAAAEAAALREANAVLLEAVRQVGKCKTCRGKGIRSLGCTLCGDSTYDHHCNDRDVVCVDCNGTGTHPAAQSALDKHAAMQGADND